MGRLPVHCPIKGINNDSTPNMVSHRLAPSQFGNSSSGNYRSTAETRTQFRKLTYCRHLALRICPSSPSGRKSAPETATMAGPARWHNPGLISIPDGLSRRLQHKFHVQLPMRSLREGFHGPDDRGIQRTEHRRVGELHTYGADRIRKMF